MYLITITKYLFTGMETLTTFFCCTAFDNSPNNNSIPIIAHSGPLKLEALHLIVV